MVKECAFVFVSERATVLWAFLYPCKIQIRNSFPVLGCRLCSRVYACVIFFACVLGSCVRHRVLMLKNARVCVLFVCPHQPISQPAVRCSAGEPVCMSQSSPSLLQPAFTFAKEEKKKNLILTFSAQPSRGIDNYEIKRVIALLANAGMVIAHLGRNEFRSLWVIPPPSTSL